MPVQHVHLHRFHSIEVAFEDIEGNEMAADVNQQTTPGEPRLIFNRYYGDCKPLRRYFDQLQESLQAVQNAKWIRRVERGAGRRDYQLVRFIFAELLHPLAIMIRVDDQRRM